MRIGFLAFSALLLFFSSGLNAQNYAYQKLDKTDSVSGVRPEGQVEIIQDSRIDSIVKMHIAYNKQLDGIKGYRVQVFFDAGNNSLDKAQMVAEEFQLLFPGDTAYISFSEPYYKVRVGDFRTRLEAEGYMQKILGDYPNAFVIKDQIRFPEID
jgi:hypothetical protein